MNTNSTLSNPATNNTNNTNNPNNGEYKEIKLYDLTANQILDFDIYIYLSINNKFIKYLSRNNFLDDDQLLRLKCKHVIQLFIHKDDINNYNKYLSSSIKGQISQNNLSDNQKMELIKNSACNIIESVNSITGDDGAITWTNNCINLTKIIVSDLSETKISTIYDKLRGLLSTKPTLINHSLSVSSLGVVFGMALGIHDAKSISELALGGLLHDIGFSNTSVDLVEKYLNSNELTSEELSQLKTHPSEGYQIVGKILKSAKITDNIIKIILEHHENAAGSGYPIGKGLPSLSYLCKIVAIADKTSIDILKYKTVDLKYSLAKLLKAQEERREYDKVMLTQLLTVIK
ncbi:MAG: HD domain-containing protein [Oligoflexia bacterium]|nr:HD domain-containing protein [Oligoflexia bacterium]